MPMFSRYTVFLILVNVLPILGIKALNKIFVLMMALHDMLMFNF